MACFADANVSQGSAAIYARCGGIFNTHLTANLPGNLPVKISFFSNKLPAHTDFSSLTKFKRIIISMAFSDYVHCF